MNVDPSFQARMVFRSGLAALVPGMFGMGWLGSGLGIVHAFTPIVINLFDVTGILILASSIYFIRKGRALLRNSPAAPNPMARNMRTQFGNPASPGQFRSRHGHAVAATALPRSHWLSHAIPCISKVPIPRDGG